MGPFTCLIEKEKPSILVVDDHKSNLELMEAVFLKEGFKVYTALGGSEAIHKFQNHPIDVAVLDVMMPEIDGFELCSKLKNISGKRFFPVILLTALTDKSSKLKGLESGADDFISKPFDTAELILKIKSLLKVKSLNDDLDHSENIIMTLAVAMEARDPYTKGHSTRVSKLAAEFVSYLGLPEKDRQEMKKAGILHDIGKICLSETLLRKPGPLTKEEVEMIKTHTILGEDLCRPLVSMRKILPAIRNHHERWDGMGFPDGLAGEDIPLMARILAIVDSFDAMVSVRPYRDRRSVGETIKTMKSEQYDGQWDSELLNYFIEMIGSLINKGLKIDA
ncbi:MAG: response regulator [Nitrospirae bacterium]|nr:response regulator [Nitrospirota bacterium]